MLIAPEALGFDEMILISSVPRRKERYLRKDGGILRFRLPNIFSFL